MKNILVLCTGNSCRSQMAEGFLRKYLNDEFMVFSAGIEAHGVNPIAVDAMKEIGIDISEHTSNTIDELPKTDFRLLLTVCDNAKEKCPYFPATSAIHHNFPDPAKTTGTGEEILNSFRKTRDMIDNFCKKLAENLS